MFNLSRLRGLAGQITGRPSRTESRRWLNLARKPLRTLGVEELEDRVVPSLMGQQLFPSDNPWNQNISTAPVAANSAAIISHIGASTPLHPDWGADNPANGGSPLYGIPFNIVHGNSLAKVNVIINNYPGESDIVSVPIPANAVIEGDYQNGPNPNGGGYNSGQRGDSHLIIWDEDTNIAYELYGVTRPSDTTLFPNTSGVELPHTDGMWHAAQETVWNMNTDTFRTLGETSADAAGLSILAGLVRPDEGLTVAQGGQGVINHALRVTLPGSDVNPQYIYPASHMVSESQGADNLPLGGRLRLENTPAVDALISNMPPESQIIATAMQQYGLIVADIGSAMFVTGASATVDDVDSPNTDLVWNLNDIFASNGLEALTAGDFQVVNLQPQVTGLSPTSGSAGATITITGQNFSGAAGHLSVFFGSVAASSVTFVRATEITAVIPSGSGTVNVTVQSGVNETDNISSNPNANVNAPIFGYGTSAITAADQFTYNGQTISGTNSTDSFATSTVVSGSTDILTLVIKDTTGNAVSGLASSAFHFSLAGGASSGTFGAATATVTPGTYTTFFTGTTAGTASSVITTITGVTLTTSPAITVNVGPVSSTTSTVGFASPTAAVGGTDTLTIVVEDGAGNAVSGLPSSSFGFTLSVGTSTGTFSPVIETAKKGTYTTIFTATTPGSTAFLTTTINGQALGSMPNITVGVSPSGTITTDTPTFTWAPATGASYYDLWVDDLSTGQSQVLLLPNLTGGSVTLTAAQALTPGQSYRWWIGAVSTNGTTWSSAQYFSIAALAAPAPSGPSGVITTQTPTVAWSTVTGAARYDLWVDDLSTGQSQVVLLPNLTGGSVTLTAAQALTPGQSYRWWIGAVSTNGLATTWSSAQYFSIAALATPAPSGPSGAITTQLPTFAWSTVTGAARYDLWVDDLSTGQSQVVLLPNLTGGSVTLTAAQALTPGQNYRWWIGAVSTNGLATAWSSAQYFSIAGLAAPAPSGPSGAITTQLPTFAWSTVTEAARYDLWVDDLSTGQSQVVLLPNLTGGSVTLTAAQALTPGQSYRWWIGAVSTNGIATAWSSVQYFSIT